MSETIVAAIIGAVAGIVVGIISGIITYRTAKKGWEKEATLEKERRMIQRRTVQDERRWQLNNDIKTHLSSALTDFVIQHAHEDEYINALDSTSQTAIKSLWLTEGQENEDLGNKLTYFMTGYFENLREYGHSSYQTRVAQVTQDRIEACRQETKTEVKKILNSILNS